MSVLYHLIPIILSYYVCVSEEYDLTELRCQHHHTQKQSSVLKCRQCHTILWLGAVSSLPYRSCQSVYKGNMFRHVVLFLEIFLDYTVDTTDTKPHCNDTDKQTNEQTHK